MGYFWFNFKEKSTAAPRGWPIEELRKLILRFEEDAESAVEWWRIAAHRRLTGNDIGFVFKQGRSRRGIFGYGPIVGPAEMRDSEANSDGVRWRAPIRFNKIVDPTTSMLLDMHDMEYLVPESTIKSQSSGVTLAASVGQKLVDMLERK